MKWYIVLLMLLIIGCNGSNIDTETCAQMRVLNERGLLPVYASDREALRMELAEELFVSRYGIEPESNNLSLSFCKLD